MRNRDRGTNGGDAGTDPRPTRSSNEGGAILLRGCRRCSHFPTFVAVAADRPFGVGIVSLVNGRSSPQFVAFEQRLRELASAAEQDLTIDFTVLDGHADLVPGRDAGASTARCRRVCSRRARRSHSKRHGPRRRRSRSSWSRSITTRSRSAMCRAWRGRASDHHRGLSGHDRVCREARAAIERSGPRHHSVHRLLGRCRARQLRGDGSGSAGAGAESAVGGNHHPPYDYEAALATAAPGPGDALLCMLSPYFFHDLKELDALAIRHHLPSMCGGVNSGGLIAYAPSLNAIFRTAAEYVDKIRRGAKLPRPTCRSSCRRASSSWSI